MLALRRLAAHPLAGSGIRYGISGATVAAVYLGVPLALVDGAGMPIQVAIPIAYVLAVTLHFNLQRHFVFRHVGTFALSRRQQITRYVIMGSFQYPLTALATAVLPSLLGLSAEVTFVIVSLTMSLTIFGVLRTHIFHAGAAISGTHPEVGELELLDRGGSAGERQPDPIEAGVKRDGQAYCGAD